MFLPRIHPLHFGCSRGLAATGASEFFYALGTCVGLVSPDLPPAVSDRLSVTSFRFFFQDCALAPDAGRVEAARAAAGNGRGSWIRTNDLQYPKLPRYQAALYPDVLEGPFVLEGPRHYTVTASAARPRTGVASWGPERERNGPRERPRGRELRWLRDERASVRG